MRYVIFSKDSSPLLNISSIGYAKNPKITRFGPGTRNAYIVHYVISGKGYFNGSTVCAGQGFLITPGMLEEYFPDRSDPWEFLWTYSYDEKFADLLPYFSADPKTSVFNFNFSAKLKEFIPTLTSNTSSLYSSFEMLEFFMSIFKNHFNSPSNQSSLPNTRIYFDAAVNYIQSNIFTPVTVQDLTTFLGITQPYLYRIFKKYLSVSPKQYIIDVKLKKAQNLLKETNLTVTQVANSVGFKDVVDFSKFFSSRIGISPLIYRKKGLPSR